MVDFSFFRSRTFLGANIVAFIVSFAMLAMFFFLALYMQNIRGYSPLQAGVRFLPSTVMIIVIAPLAGRLADRVGSRPLITFGLLCVSGALFWQSHLTVSSGYGALLPGFMLMGVGMGFVMSPMSLAAMNAVDRAKAGVASGILSMNRMVGGTFGVAILGALVATLGRSKIDQLLPQLPDSARSRLASGLGSGGVQHGVPARVVDASQQAFVYALHYGLLLGSGVALLGALAAFTLIRRSPGDVETTGSRRRAVRRGRSRDAAATSRRPQAPPRPRPQEPRGARARASRERSAAGAARLIGDRAQRAIVKLSVPVRERLPDAVATTSSL